MKTNPESHQTPTLKIKAKRGRPKAEHPTTAVQFKLRRTTAALLRRKVQAYRRSAFADEAIRERLGGQ